jgi:predicted nucleic acid-binding protein
LVLPDTSVWVGKVADGMRETLSSLSWAELDTGGWQEVGATARLLRREGKVLPLTDLEIAVTATRAGHYLWTFDADFERIRAVLDGLELYEPNR